jgi:hypothetical protein
MSNASMAPFVLDVRVLKLPPWVTYHLRFVHCINHVGSRYYSRYALGKGCKLVRCDIGKPQCLEQALIDPSTLSSPVRFRSVTNTQFIVRNNLALLCYIGDSLPKTSFSVLVSFPAASRIITFMYKLLTFSPVHLCT